ncbi:MAG: CRISPR-associated CARF protein Csa3 [Vulcanisaeta sp.]
MPKLFVIPLGFQVDYVVRFLVRVGIGNGDAVLVLLPEQSGEDERMKSEKALKDLGEFLRKVGELRIMPEHVDTRDPGRMVVGILNAILKHVSDYDSVMMAVTGGVRVFSAVSPLIAIMLRGLINKEIKLFVVSENLIDYVDLTEVLPAFKVLELSEGLIDVLTTLHRVSGADRCVGVDEIAEVLGKDTSTVRRQMYDLEDRGLVASLGARRRCFSLTSSGKILATFYAGLQMLEKRQ